MSKTYALVYGFLEGPWHGKQLRQELGRLNMTEARPEDADIVVSHSGGCYFVPSTSKKVLLIDPPYWPQKFLLLSLWQNTFLNIGERSSEGHMRLWLTGQFWWLYYGLGRLIYNVRLAYRAATRRFDANIPGHIFIARNDKSVFCSPAINLLKPNQITVKAFPGDHNDVWTNPKPYAEYIEGLTHD